MVSGFGLSNTSFIEIGSVSLKYLVRFGDKAVEPSVSGFPFVREYLLEDTCNRSVQTCYLF